MKKVQVNIEIGKSIISSVSLVITLTVVLFSCESFLEADPPKSRILEEIVFSDDVSATSAVTGIYHDMLTPESFASGSFQSVAGLTGLSSDELYHYAGMPEAMEFEQNTLTPDNTFILLMWTSMYKTIYQANAVIEGLRRSTGITSPVKSQLEGEALFIRAFSNFYLINMFGDVPLASTTDYRINATLERTSTDLVYEQIVQDLITAQSLLSENYVTVEDNTSINARVRPNQSTATAMLARVYLYRGEWAKAEAQASLIIDNTSLYGLVDLNKVFLKNSKETIWQLRPTVPGINTLEGFDFIIDGGIQYNVLNEQLVDAFEDGDTRLMEWVGEFDTGDGIVHFPYKYKVYASTVISEYSMVFRLAEQYLIRAEARAKQTNPAGAIADLDMIRNRADLPGIDPAISAEDLLLAIEHERQIELFMEWGHRWFDLKRTNRVNTVLGALKSDWNPEDALYPIPRSEFSKNPKLGTQNPGY